MKKCSICGLDKPLDDFNRCSCSKDGRQWKCRGCSSSHYEAHKPQYLSQVKASSEARRQRAYCWLWGYLLEHPCLDCGEDDPVVLDFDHVRGVKIGDVKRMATQARSLTLIAAEVEKCDVRCANCHRRKTAREQGSRFWVMATQAAIAQLDRARVF